MKNNKIFGFVALVSLLLILVIKQHLFPIVSRSETTIEWKMAAIIVASIGIPAFLVWCTSRGYRGIDIARFFHYVCLMLFFFAGLVIVMAVKFYHIELTPFTFCMIMLPCGLLIADIVLYRRESKKFLYGL